MAAPTQNGVLQKDDNGYPVMGGTSSSDDATIINSAFDPITRRLLTDASGGSGITLITVSGTIDDTNTSFTSASQPQVLVINGGTYQSTGGAITWTYVAGTITLSSPIGSGGSIFGMA